MRSRAVISALSQANLPRDGVVLMHSSFKTCAHEGFGAQETLDAIINYMSPGTLMLPAMSWRYVTRENPNFDELNTPSNTGILSELFRTRYASHRSIHPTHSVCGLGREAEYLLSGHHKDMTPCSDNSPFGRLVAADGWVVMFGIGVDCCTLIHHVEEKVAIDHYLRPIREAEEYHCRTRAGDEISVKVRKHFTLPRDYWQFQDILAAHDKIKISTIGNTIVRTFRARDMVQLVAQMLNDLPDVIIARPGQRYRMM